MDENISNKAFLLAIGSLRDFLDIKTSEKQLSITFKLHPAVKDVIEAQGIPHTAVFKVDINGTKQSLTYNLRDGDRIVLYPFEAVENNECEPIYVRPKTFIGDVHLGKLVRTLRLLGLDTTFNSNWNEQTIIKRSNAKQRMILTRDLELLQHGQTQYGYWIRATNPSRQVEELFERFELTPYLNPFTRCMKCNGVLRQTDLEPVKEQVPPKVQEWHSTYWQCSICQKVYWKGSHYKKLQQRVKELRNR